VFAALRTASPLQSQKPAAPVIGFAPLNVSGLSECFVFRGFFAKKNNLLFFLSIELK